MLGSSVKAMTSSWKTYARPTGPRSTVSRSVVAGWPMATSSSWRTRPCSSDGRADAADLPPCGQGRVPDRALPVRRPGGPGGGDRRVRSPRRPPRELVVTDASGRRTIPLKESITLGRAATCDLVVADNYVSNVHARIYLRDGSYWLEDLGSTNGTYMNRSRVSTPTAIGPGDDIRMGKATLELRR